MQAVSSAIGYQNDLVKAIVANDRFVRICDELRRADGTELRHRRAALDEQRTRYHPDELILLEELEKKVHQARPQQRVDQLRMALQIELSGELASITKEVVKREPNYLVLLREKRAIMQKVVQIDMGLLEQLSEPMKTHDVGLLYLLAETSESKEIQAFAIVFEQASGESREDLAKEALEAIEQRKSAFTSVDERRFGLEEYIAQYSKKAADEQVFSLYETMLHTLPEGYQEEAADRQIRRAKLSSEELATIDYLRREISRRARAGFSQRFMDCEHLSENQKNDPNICAKNLQLIYQAIEVSVSESVAEVTNTIRAIYPELLLHLMQERNRFDEATKCYKQHMRTVLTFSDEVLEKLQIYLRGGWYRDLEMVVEAKEFFLFMRGAPRDLRRGLMADAAQVVTKELERRKEVLGILFFRLERVFKAECSQQDLVEKWKRLLQQEEPKLTSELSKEQSRLLTIFACLFYLRHFAQMQTAIASQEKATSWVKCTGVIILELFQGKTEAILADLKPLLATISLQEIEKKIYEEIEFLENLQEQSINRLSELLVLLEENDERLIWKYLEERLQQDDLFLQELAYFLENGTDFFEETLVESLRLLVAKSLP